MLNEIHKARPQIKAQAVKVGPVFWKEADTSAAVKDTGKAGEPQTTQGALSRKRQTAISSSDKVRIIDNAILQSKIEKTKNKNNNNTTKNKNKISVNSKYIGPDTGATELEVETQRQACNGFWRTTYEAATSEDYKLYSESEDWRKRAVEADGEVFRAVKCEGTRGWA